MFGWGVLGAAYFGGGPHLESGIVDAYLQDFVVVPEQQRLCTVEAHERFIVVPAIGRRAGIAQQDRAVRVSAQERSVIV
jgi:hypothetical protein